MRKPKYVIMLTEDEVLELEAIVAKGKRAARVQTRARILLKSASGCPDDEIMAALGVSGAMCYSTRRACIEGGIDAALNDKPRPGRPFKLIDKQCAHVIATACSAVPDGRDHWTLRMLAERAVQLEFADTLSHETVRQLLKKHAKTLAD